MQYALSPKNVKSISDINVTEVFDEVMSLAAQNHVSIKKLK